MNGRIVRSRRSGGDLAWIYHTIGQNNERAADRFLTEAEKTFRRLASMPGIGELFDSLDPDLGQIRRSLISKHKNYVVYYAPIEGGIRVLRVIHSAREPEDLVGTEDFE